MTTPPQPVGECPRCDRPLYENVVHHCGFAPGGVIVSAGRVTLPSGTVIVPLSRRSR